jgi:hypothetical protein
VAQNSSIPFRYTHANATELDSPDVAVVLNPLAVQRGARSSRWSLVSRVTFGNGQRISLHAVAGRRFPRRIC